MKNILYTILVAFAVAMMCVTGHSKGRDRASVENERKADYIYLEALKAKALGNNDATYDLLLRAHSLNPADKEIGNELSNYVLALSNGDSIEVARGYRLVRDYYYSNPADYFPALRYGLLSENLGNTAEARKVWTDLHSRYPEKLELTYKFADFLSSTGDSAGRARAIEIYDSIELIDGKSIPVSTKKIQIYYGRNDTTGVFREAHRLLSSSPQSVDYNVFLGDLYSMFEMDDSALYYYDRACEIDPTSGLASYSRANFFNSIGDTARYDSEVFQALVQDNLDVNTKLVILRSYIEKMYTDSTEQPRIDTLFDVLIDQHPHEHDIHDMYSRYLIVKKDYAAAAEQTELTLDLDPDDEQGWDILSSLYFQIDDTVNADKATARALRYFPENSQFYIKRSVSLMQTNRPDSALAELDRALNYADSTDMELMSRIYLQKGSIHYENDEKDKGLKEMETAIAYDPENGSALNNVAYFYAVDGVELDKALDYINRALELDQMDRNTMLDTYAWVLFRRKEYDKAKEAIDSVLEDEELHTAEVLEHAGDIYFMSGHPDEAVGFWEEALKLDPENELLSRKVKNKTYFYK